jgi:hypothetical protein
MPVYRCDWCGRFYSSPLPDGSACPNHIFEDNERRRKSIERHNAKVVVDREAFDRAHGLRPIEEPR